ncbi:MAG: phosphoribosylformylglycinamidine cyclo-ligase [Phycisphaerales bacterium]|nr:phosphoribosylformylglycinamidine cyclo-ligase [Phycisphaerales bacterium]
MSSTPVTKGLTYRDAGVNIDAGDEVVDLIQPVLKRTHSSRVLGRHGAFAGMFQLDFTKKSLKRNYRRPVLVACTDGVGTKVLMAAERRVYDSVGIDCVAMNVNDLIVQGAEPLFFLDYLGLSKLQPAETSAMIEGVARGCEIAGCALLGGECAEMPDIYKPGDFDIAGFCVGVVEYDNIIDSTRVKKGDVIIGLESSGVHSNGYTLVRRIVRDAGLDLNATYAELGERTLCEILLEPTRIYAKSIVKLVGAFRKKKAISGMAHITGGGLPGNVSRALPKKLDAVIEKSAWSPNPIFPFLQKHGGVEEAEMFRVFNMGIGYTIIARPEQADRMMKSLKRAGEKPTIIGAIEKGSGEVRLK